MVKEEKKKEVVKKETKTIVVNELPTQQLREAVDESNNKVELITVNEALTEILEICRDLKEVL